MRQLFIDAGHCTRFPGASGIVKEDVRNGHLADVFADYAQKIGWTIVRVPREFKSDPKGTSSTNLIQRIAFINSKCHDGDWVISIHANADASGKANGIETCYMGGSEYMHTLAKSLTKRVSLATGLKVRGDGSYPDDRPTASGRSRIAMVRDTKPCALLIEAGFVTNGKDMAIPLAEIGKAMAEWFEDLNGGWLKDPKI